MITDRVPREEYERAGDLLKVSPVLIRAQSIKETHNGDERAHAIRFENGRSYWKRYRLASREAKAFDRRGNSSDMAKRWAQFREMDAVCQRDAVINPAAADAAILSHSHGWPQIMGVWFTVCDYSSARTFFDAMHGSIAAQTEAYVAFVKADSRLHGALQREDLETVARIYNGPRHARNKYVPGLLANMDRIHAEWSGGHAFA